MLVPYTCCTKKFEDYYANQNGEGMPYYKGVGYQKGFGIGGFFAKLFRRALPFLVSGAKSVGKEALRVGTRVASDVLAGEKFKTAVESRAKEGGKNLARKAVHKADQMIGRGKNKRKRKRSNRVISSKVRKVVGRDIFDS